MAKRYFKNLDGLRFIAAITVALSHLETMKQYRNIAFVHNRFFENSAQLAVTFFFVLSGFLIMWWLLEETNGNTEKINIRAFYTNRLARTWPLYFLIVFIGIFISLFNGTFQHDLFAIKRYTAYFFFLPNTADLYFGKDVYLGQTWSLAVEECFYFSFPLLLSKVPKQKLLKTLFALMVVFMVLSTLFNPIFLHNLFLGLSSYKIIGILTTFFERYRFYSFFSGALAALLLFHQMVPALFYRAKNWSIIGGLILGILYFFGVTLSFLTQQIYSILFALFLLLITRSNKGILLLNNKLFIWCGKRSYGIYMLHMFCVMRLINQGSFLLQGSSKPLSIFISWIVYLVAVLLTAHLSYQLFENPIRSAVRKQMLLKKAKIEN